LYVIDQTEDIKILIKSRFVSQPIHYVIDVESATLKVKKSQQVSKEEFPEIKQKSVFKSDTYQLHWMYMEEIPARYRTPPHQPISSYRLVTRHLVIKDENNHSVLGDTLKFYYQGVLREFSTDFGINLPGFDRYIVIDKEHKLTSPSDYTCIATISHDNKFLYIGYIKLNNLKREKYRYPIMIDGEMKYSEYWSHYDSELEKVVAYELDSKKIVGVSYYYNINFKGEYLPADRKIDKYKPLFRVFTHNAIKDKLIYFSQDEIKTIDIKGCFTDDNDPPVVEITKPAGTLNGSSVAVSEISGTFSLKGNVKDVSGIQYVKINDQPATVWRDSFSIILSLKEGENEVNIVCSDYKNNISTFYFTILFTQKKPVIIAEKKPTVTILPDVSKYKNLGSGSGFFIDTKGYIVTNHHVIDNHKVILVGLFNPSGNNFDIYQAVSVKEDPINDLALLKITSNSFTPIPSLPYRISISDSKVSDRVFVLGYPKPADLGLELKYTEGVINSLSGFKGNPIHYQISANILGGNSGGPLFNYSNGEIVGVIVSSYISGELTNYAIKASVLKKFLSGVPDITVPVVKSSLPALSHSKYETLKLYVPIILNYY
jgi:S1-C subfamily serine protease